MTIINRFLLSSIVTFTVATTSLPDYQAMCDVGPNTRDIIIMFLSIVSGIVTVLVTTFTKNWIEDKRLERSLRRQFNPPSSQVREDIDLSNPQTAADPIEKIKAKNWP